jgi:hypothetical protein
MILSTWPRPYEKVTGFRRHIRFEGDSTAEDGICQLGAAGKGGHDRDLQGPGEGPPTLFEAAVPARSQAYGYEKYGRASAHLVSVAGFQNTNIPPGHQFRPWTIEEAHKSVGTARKLVTFSIETGRDQFYDQPG